MNYVKISFVVKTKPPYFIGSQLRGALGYALKKVTCINPSFICNGCFMASNCLYYSFYEEKNIFHKYRFDFELGKDYYDFSFYLFDDVCDKLPYLLSAFYLIFTQNGLGYDRKVIEKEDLNIYINNISCIENGNLNIPQKFITLFKIDEIYSDIKLKFVTPLRLKKNNRFIRDDSFELKDIINSIYQRQMRLIGYSHKKFPYPIEGNIVKKEINYQKLTRRSNRQQTTMNLDGIVGEIEIKNLNKECFEVLKLGEIIGVGKQTVFGLGKIKLFNL
jgi:hypothetical protein